LKAYDKQNVLTLSQTLTLTKYVPTTTERESLQAYQGDIAKLGKAEKFMLQICTVPNLEETLSVISVQQQFEPDYELVKKNVAIMTAASAEIQSSTRLTKVLEYILALGNHLNKGTARAMAGGFKLEGLIKFTETKGVDQNTTLLHYLVQTISTKNPDLLELTNDLANVKLAAKMSVASVHSSFKELETGLNIIKQALPAAPAEAELEKTLSSLSLKITRLEQEIGAMDKEVHAVLAYFGEQNLELEEPFRIIDQFIDLFNTATSDVAKAKKRREDKEARRAGKSRSGSTASNSLKKVSKSKSTSQAPSSPSSKGKENIK